MLEAYSTNLTVAQDEAFPLNSVSVEKGCNAVLASPSSVKLNSCGVYEVTVDGFASASAAGEITVQMTKDGVAQPQAVSTVTGATGETDVFGFKTLVQVSHNNTNCPCTSPVTLQFNNTGVAIEGAHINVTVVKK